MLEDDRTRFLDKVGDAGGGQYVINTKHLLGELTAAAADGIVLEKFGSKALRIFRVVRQVRVIFQSKELRQILHYRCLIRHGLLEVS